MTDKNIFYIDESGNSGDAILKRSDITPFDNQPYFSLGCIGHVTSEIEEYLTILKLKYKIKTKELKASRIYKKNPEFLIDLLNYLLDNNCAIIIELMNKNILSQLI